MSKVLRIVSNANAAQVVDAYTWAFFEKPSGLFAGMSIKGQTRRANTWAPCTVQGSKVAARLIETTNRINNSAAERGHGPGTGFVILMRIEGEVPGRTEVTLALDDFTVGSITGRSPQEAMLKFYTKLVAGRLQEQGHSQAIEKA